MAKRVRDDNEEPAYSGSWSSVHVKCPFWQGETKRAIVCEGLRKGENIRRLLPSEEDKTQEMRRYCCKDYVLCKLFQLLYGEYQ